MILPEYLHQPNEPEHAGSSVRAASDLGALPLSEFVDATVLDLIPKIHASEVAASDDRIIAPSETTHRAFTNLFARCAEADASLPWRARRAFSEYGTTYHEGFIVPNPIAVGDGTSRRFITGGFTYSDSRGDQSVEFTMEPSVFAKHQPVSSVALGMRDSGGNTYTEVAEAFAASEQEPELLDAVSMRSIVAAKNAAVLASMIKTLEENHVFGDVSPNGSWDMYLPSRLHPSHIMFIQHVTRPGVTDVYSVSYIAPIISLLTSHNGAQYREHIIVEEPIMNGRVHKAIVHSTRGAVRHDPAHVIDDLQRATASGSLPLSRQQAVKLYGPLEKRSPRYS